MSRFENSIERRELIRLFCHHTKPEALDWLEDTRVRSVLGLASNVVLRREGEPMLERSARVWPGLFTKRPVLAAWQVVTR